jgi:hypothetical protein
MNTKESATMKTKSREWSARKSKRQKLTSSVPWSMYLLLGIKTLKSLRTATLLPITEASVHRPFKYHSGRCRRSQDSNACNQIELAQQFENTRFCEIANPGNRPVG